jgi:formylglycine-generating enzyme required for sulfatase activity
LALILSLLAAGEPEKPAKVALLVGINKYDRRGFDDLRYAERDVEDLRKELESAGFRVILLKGSATGKDRATRANIEERLAELLKGATKETVVLVALSGHGQQLEVKADGKTKEDALFCPVDAVKDDPETLFSLSHLIDDALARRGGRNLVLVDACRDQPKDLGRGSRGVQGRVVALPEDTAVLFSCRAGQQSFESDEAGGGHGLFSYCVLEGLREKLKKDGQVTWSALVSYVEDRMASKEVQGWIPKGREQEPIPAGNVGRVVLARRDVPREPEPDRTEAARPKPLDCTGDGVSADEVRRAQEAWARYLARKVEETIEVADGVKMTFVLVPPGKFLMGSPRAEQDYVTNTYYDGKRPNWLDNETQHTVTLTEPFDLAKTEVTQEQYEALTGENPSKFKGKDKPVEQVSYDEAKAYAKKLEKKRDDRHLYRLPTQAEWEYSCRGGRSSSKPFGVGDGRALSSRQANFDGNYPYGGADKGPYLESTCAVASYTANALGLYDMHGNVNEWCADWYGPYPVRDVTNPTGPSEGSSRVHRGGGWYDYAGYCRAAYRYWNEPGLRDHSLGFRLARSVPSGSR